MFFTISVDKTVLNSIFWMEPLKNKLHSFPSYTLLKIWDNLSLTLKRISTFNTFQKYLKKAILDSFKWSFLKILLDLLSPIFHFTRCRCCLHAPGLWSSSTPDLGHTVASYFVSGSGSGIQTAMLALSFCYSKYKKI